MRTLLIGICMAVVLLLQIPHGNAQTDQDFARKLKELGPEDHYFVPKDLADLVNTAQASVVAQI